MKYLRKFEQLNDDWFEAASKGDLTIIKEYINKGFDIDIQNDRGDTALIGASYHGYLDIVKELIKAGASLDMQNKLGNTLLMFASWQGRLGIVKELIKAGASLDIQNNNGNTALDYNDLWKEYNTQEYIIKYQPHNFHLIKEVHPKIKEKYPELMDSIDLGLL